MTCPHRWKIPQSDKCGPQATGVCIMCETTREFTNVYIDKGFNATGALATPEEEAYLRLTDTRKSIRHRTDSIGRW